MVELKSIIFAGECICLCTSNRTMVELKFKILQFFRIGGIPSNRTMVELKYIVFKSFMLREFFQSDHGGIEI